MPPFLPLHCRRPLSLPSRCFLARILHSSPPGKGLDQVGPIACRLKSRSVLRFRGPDTIKFLQGLLTNDVRPLSDESASSSSSVAEASSLSTPNVALNSAKPVYSAMLTPQGRFLYDFFLYRPAKASEMLDRTGSGLGSDVDDSEQTLLADVDSTLSDEILNCLKKYRLRSKVEIENVSEKFSCWQRFGGELSVSSSSNQDPNSAAIGRGGATTDRAGATGAQGNNLGWRWYKDPRLCCLGFRGIFPSDTIPPLVERDKETDEQNYLLWRVERGIAEGSIEIPKGEAIPLEYNLVGLNSISFDKGCYVGQEFVARTHHRGVIRKRLISLKFTNERGSDVERKVVPGSDVVDAASNKKIGNVTTSLGCRGMGVLRLEDAFRSSSLVIKEEHDVKVDVVKPDWWPTEWTQDLE